MTFLSNRQQREIQRFWRPTHPGHVAWVQKFGKENSCSKYIISIHGYSCIFKNITSLLAHLFDTQIMFCDTMLRQDSKGGAPSFRCGVRISATISGFAARLQIRMKISL